jgi:hypothetical protein
MLSELNQNTGNSYKSSNSVSAFHRLVSRPRVQVHLRLYKALRGTMARGARCAVGHPINHGEFQMRMISACAAVMMALAAPHSATAQQQLNGPAVTQQAPTQQTPSSGATPAEQQGVDRAMRSESGKAGTQEPSAARRRRKLRTRPRS